MLAHRLSRPLALVGILSLAVATAACEDGGGGGADAGGDGPGWRVVENGPGGAIIAVWGSEDGDVYCVGGNPGTGSGPSAHVLRDGAWSTVPTAGAQGHLWWVAGIDERTVYMTGEGATILLHNPQTGETTVEDLPDGVPADTTIFGLAGLSPDDVYAVGTGDGKSLGVALHKGADGAWRDLSPDLPAGAVDGNSLWKVWVVAPDDVWIVGEHAQVLRRSGDTWSRVPLPIPEEKRQGTTLLTVHAGADGRPVAVGTSGAYGLVVEWDGEQFVAVCEGRGCPPLSGVRVGAGGLAVAVGNSAAAMWRRDGAWQVDWSIDVGHDLHTVWLSPSGEAWAAGGAYMGGPGSMTTLGTLVYSGDDAPPPLERGR